MTELTSLVRDFARHVVELQKPKGNIWANKWVWIVIIILVAIMIILFIGPVIQTVGTLFDNPGATNAINTANQVVQRR